MLVLYYHSTRYTPAQAPDSPLAYNWSFFEETDHYWKPASDSTQLYHQLHAKKYREVNRKQVQ